jgi:hypothetical protein
MAVQSPTLTTTLRPAVRVAFNAVSRWPVGAENGSVALSWTVPRGTRRVVAVRSDGSGELGERGRDAPMMPGFDGESVVAAANVLHERVARA